MKLRFSARLVMFWLASTALSFRGAKGLLRHGLFKTRKSGIRVGGLLPPPTRHFTRHLDITPKAIQHTYGGTSPRNTLKQSLESTEGSLSSVAKGDTIYALSSGHGVVAGVAIIRISGPRAQEVLEQLTAPPPDTHQFAKGKIPTPRMACMRKIFDPETKELLDESLVLWFPGPKSFTGEDTVELHVHGSRAVVSGVLEGLGKLSPSSVGAVRVADRGEFTQRAFRNGRLDLTEVEGLADLIAADTAAQRRQALKQMGGSLSALYLDWRARLAACLAHTEAVIDFGDDEEDVGGDGPFEALRPRAAALLGEVRRHLGDGRRGEILRQGVRVALLGPPNAGKSSLLNRLARRPAAIVSPIAGTTRDVVEVQLDLGGLPVVLSDTAGLREAAATGGDAIEVEGMRRAVAAAGGAHLAVFVADLARGHEGAALLREVSGGGGGGGGGGAGVAEGAGAGAALRHLFAEGAVLVVGNKRDLLPGEEGGQAAAAAAAALAAALPADADGAAAAAAARGGGSSSSGGGGGGDPAGGANSAAAAAPAVWPLSCDTGEGLDAFLSHLEERVRERFESPGEEAAVITRARHRRHLERTEQALGAFEGLAAAGALDLAAEELRVAARELGCIIGIVDVEEILDIIFKDFCIGK